MVEEAVEMTRVWFGARHTAWVTGDCEAMCGALCAGPEVVRVARVEMERWRTLGERRRVCGRKAISDVRVRSVEALAEDRVRVEAEEAMRLLYDIGSHTHHEQRTIRHLLVWEHRGTVWRLAAHAQETEASWATPMAPGGLDAGVPTGTADPPGAGVSPMRVGTGSPDTPGEEQYRAAYDPTRAFRYAEQWWNDHNLRFQNMGVDCTNFVSQVLYAGGYPMARVGDRANGWWYRFGAHPSWSYSWAGANALAGHLRASRAPFRTRLAQTPEELSVGDVICYDWKGTGQFGHNTVVVGHDEGGRPLVDAHTVNSHQRYFSYEDSYAWTPRTQYLFVHFEA